MKVTGIPLGVPFRSAGNGWGAFDLIEWNRVPFGLRAGDDLDELDSVDGIPVGASGIAAGEAADPIEGSAVPDDERG